MITYNILAGTVDVSVVIRIIDSADGTPETGVVFNTAGIDLEYRRELAATTDITEATLAALTTAHADGGFLHIGNGYYRLDLPDAACATGAAGVLVHGTVTGMVVIGCYINLTAWPVDVRQWLGTAVASPATAGIPDVNTKNFNNLTTVALPLVPTTAGRTLDVSATGEAGVDWANVGGPTTALNLSGTTIKTATDVETDTAVIGALGAGLTGIPWNAAWDAEVQSEVDDAINTAISELGVAAPTATPTIRTALMLMYMALRNKLVVQTSGTDAIEIYNDAGTKIASKAITDDGSDYTESEMA